MFTRQAMNLLEFAAIMCKSADDADTIQQAVSNKLKAIERRYFTVLPGP